MNEVRFFEECPRGVQVKYAVIAARYRGRWVLCRHKDRRTWEIPGGHREPGETPEQAAYRELWEETGAAKAALTQICYYAVRDYGALYLAEITEIGDIPEFSEICEVQLFDELPENLTYPHIQPYLFERVRNHLNSK